MPKLGLTMTEGLIAEWRVRPGDHVKAGDVMFVVETDKIATDIEARSEGRIERIEVAEGETAPVGMPVAIWTGADLESNLMSDAHVSAPMAEKAIEPTKDVLMELAVPASGEACERVVATPLARRIARELGVDLFAVTGSGPRGRIKADDVRTSFSAAPAAKPEDVTEIEPQAAITAKDVGRSRVASGFERTVARRLSEAKQQIPHFYVMAEADLTSLLVLRNELNAQLATRISVNHLIVLGVVRALQDFPEMNMVWDDGSLVELNSIDIGIAVETPRGLFAPVLRQADECRLELLARKANALAEQAREGVLTANDLQGGAITVSNVGMFGASWLIPIINPGQSAIIGVGKTKREFRPDENDNPELRHVLQLVVSADHRVHDGAKAARFLHLIGQLLENPFQLLL